MAGISRYRLYQHENGASELSMDETRLVTNTLAKEANRLRDLIERMSAETGG
jgi:hypothetical protein